MLPAGAAMYNQEAILASSLQPSRCGCLPHEPGSLVRVCTDEAKTRAQQLNLFSPGFSGNGDRAPTWKPSISQGRQDHVKVLDTDMSALWSQLCHLVAERFSVLLVYSGSSFTK